MDRSCGDRRSPNRPRIGRAAIVEVQIDQGVVSACTWLDEYLVDMAAAKTPDPASMTLLERAPENGKSCRARAPSSGSIERLRVPSMSSTTLQLYIHLPGRATQPCRNARQCKNFAIDPETLLDKRMGQLFTVSPDRLACYLGELSLDELLQSCKERSISGQISVECEGWPGTIQLESGRTVNASYQNRVGTAAVSLLKQLRSGEIELCPSGQDSANPGDDDDHDEGDELGDLIEFCITALMRHGEDSELSGCIRLGNGVDVAEMHFALGSLTRITLIDQGQLASIADLVDRFRHAGRPLTIGLDEEPFGWEGPTHVRPKARQDEPGDSAGKTDEPPPGVPYPVLDEMPTQPWRRPDEVTMQVKLGARLVPAGPWWRRPYTLPGAIALAAALSGVLMVILL
jgi:hypothetical protein